MIYIVHGDNIVKSRFQIINQQKKLNSQNKIELDISDITPSDLYQILFNNDLFGNAPFVILNITKSKGSSLKPFVKPISNMPKETNLVILAEKELPKSNVFIKNVAKNKNVKTVINKTVPEGNVFKFMDAVLYKRREQAYQEYIKLVEEDISPSEIFSRVLFGINAVLNVVFKAPSVNKMHSFVKSKALRQSKLYSKESLLTLYQDLYNLDKQAKTGIIDTDNLIPLTIESVLNSK